MFMGSLFIWGNRSLIGLLKNNVAGLGNPASMGVDHTCNKTRFRSLLVSRHFVIVCYDVYAYFHMAIALVVM